MHHERYMQSVVVQNFRDFYDELIILKSWAMEEGWGSKIHENHESDKENPPSQPQLSVARRILLHLEKVLKSQYRLVEVQGGGYAANYYKEAQYIMVALADEIFLNLNWTGKKEWQDNLLESHLYGTQDAGEKFFQNLDIFLQERDVSSLDLAVVYLMALGLGFQGKFRGTDEASTVLSKYRQQLYDMITYDVPINKRNRLHVFEEAYHHTLDEVDSLSISNLRPWYIALGASITLCLILFYTVWSIEAHDIFSILKQFNVWIHQHARPLN